VKIDAIRFNKLRAVELTTSALRLVAVREFGPRIAHLGLPGGDNILFWDNKKKYHRADWWLRGGHRVWVARPGADESEDCYLADNKPADFEELDNGFRLTGAMDPVTRTRRGFAVTVLGENRLCVDSFIRNCGNMLYSGSAWALTCTNPGRNTRYGVPIGDGSRWDCFNMVFFRDWGGQDGAYDDPQIQIKEDMILLTPRGRQNKRSLQAHRGIIAMSDPGRGLTFAKRSAYDPDAAYPMGCNVAFYVGPKNFMVEMETMGPQRTLKPDEEAHDVETWVVKKGAVGMKSAEEVVRLF
jgi:hypothetical protein